MEGEFRFDPLKLYYNTILETDDVRSVTALQGFSVSWRTVEWALNMIARLPADVLEKSSNINDIIAQRMGGQRSLSWAPLSVSSLESISACELAPFLILFSGEEGCAKRVAGWQSKQKRLVLHISPFNVGGRVDPATFKIEILREHCDLVLRKFPELFNSQQLAAANTALPLWSDLPDKPSGLVGHGHNITRPNYMSLLRSGRSIEAGEPFIGKTEKEYTELIIDTAEAVLKVREEAGIRPLHSLTLLRPAIILAEPSLYRGNYKSTIAKDSKEEAVVSQTLRLIQKQKGLHNSHTMDFVKRIKNSPAAKAILAARSSELRTFTVGLGLYASQTSAAVVRLSPGVNHVFPALSAYARSDRSSNKLQARLKVRRLFDSIQSGLRDAIGADRIAFIEKTGGPLKIVADAPIEWLPVGSLPLCLRYDCSRINATPGNLLMAALTDPVSLSFRPKDLQKILVVSAFEDNDQLKDVLTSAIEAGRKRWEGKVEVTFKKVSTLGQFIEVLNVYDGYILVFDGHGANNAEEPVSKIVIGGEAVDVWELRNKVRIPPIVILSACDTHGLDASSHATVGNGFLFLGARTVLATMLPVDAFASASFVSRLVYRLADFLPAAISEKKRVLNWTEVISDMLRMTFVSEMLDEFIGPPAADGTPRARIQLAANIDINAREDESWYENLIAAIADEPEAILLDSGSREDAHLGPIVDAALRQLVVD